MSKLEELTQLQEGTGIEIRRLIANFKKDSTSRKTREYLKRKVERLEELWTDFDETDSNIRESFGANLSHDYFVTDYYGGIKAMYEEALNTLEGMLIDPENQKAIEKQPTEKESKSEHPQPFMLKQMQVLMIHLYKTIEFVMAQASTQGSSFCKLKGSLIEQQWVAIQKLHHQILSSEECLPFYELEKYFDLETRTSEILIKLMELPKQPEDEVFVRPVATNQIKLPEIQLPKFEGSYSKWPQFRDLFRELVHNQPLSGCQKLWYLKGSLSGDASKLVHHLAASDSNYETAWQIITDRFENKRLAVTTILNQLLTQPQITVERATAIKDLHDNTQSSLLALEGIGVNTSNWDPILVHVIVQKLDHNSRTLWEQGLSEPRSLQCITTLLGFLEKRFQALEAISHQHRPPSTKPRNYAALASKSSCQLCKEDHCIYSCREFLDMTIKNRIDRIRQLKLCLNCLKSGHMAMSCSSRGCKICGQKHNSLLHMSADKLQSGKTTLENVNNGAKSTNGSASKVKTSLTSNAISKPMDYILLSTVVVDVENGSSKVRCRALLDSGSQLNFITSRMVKRLGLEGTCHTVDIEGIGLHKQVSRKRVNVLLESRINEFKVQLEAFVLPQIVSHQPSQWIDTSDWNIPASCFLADPHFNEPGPIDILIGAEIYYDILVAGQLKLGNTFPTLKNTVFGWTLAGKVTNAESFSKICAVSAADELFRKEIESSWILETNDSPRNTLTLAEQRCEEHYLQTTSRSPDGRFIVRLPFMLKTENLGNSRELAYKRFLAVERRLARNHELREEYVKFMEEYRRLGHMEEIDIKSLERPHYFLPHHAVIKAQSSTTKVRVVFDASAKTTTNIALNDILAKGPTVQEDIFKILLRFRLHRYVFVTDIEKMYRQILMHADDRKYQLIWWRNSPGNKLKCFQLNTVTYGTTSAPYLATKTLQYLASNSSDTYPLGSQVLKRDFYVDDCLSGNNSLATALEMQKQVRALLNSAGFNLRKWCANHPRLLEEIPAQDQEIELDFRSHNENTVSTVGLTWSPKSDQFNIKTTWEFSNEVITKRIAFSEISRLYDPLGVMEPVIVTAKIFIQRLWVLNSDWDAPLPDDLQNEWINFRAKLPVLNSIKFDRHVYAHKTHLRKQLHIFADASLKAYGAAAYMRGVDDSNIVTVRLLCAKSRVAPLKQITLPRLELCAAKTAAELANRLKEEVFLKDIPIYLWTDSEIVLSWINSESSSFPVFVANRISSIQQLSIPQQWRHVPSKENPADILSRGLMPPALINNTFWFYGPIFLHGSESTWPQPYVTKKSAAHGEKQTLQASHVSVAATKSTPDLLTALTEKRHSFRVCQRILGYIIRFTEALRKKRRESTPSEQLSSKELKSAKEKLIWLIQHRDFSDELKHLTQFGEVPNGHPLANLTPFIDDKGLMRVNGRLEASNLDYDAKHQLIMPYSNPLTKALLFDIHKENMHVGPQTLLAIARQWIWPIKGKTLARSVVQHCVRCNKFKPKLLSQRMGNLPKHRVQPARPFLNSGVDFCGPLETHFKIRGKRPQKSYIAVFVCFATKATHLELVSDLTTQAFLGALRRFSARRGHCQNIYCDNGTNFIGARNKLQMIGDMLKSKTERDKISSCCTSKGIEFHFIPPRGPHFGGLWEAAVKSAKHLLHRTIGNVSLTYEELETVVLEAEAILNSRPLTPLSTDPNDFAALTPGHFLIGEPLTSFPDPEATHSKSGLLTRWRLVSQLKETFWKRWSSEYLNQLQHRYKWKQIQGNVPINTMVLIKEDNTPPFKWPLGRIIKLIKGSDGLIRVAEVRTIRGTICRPIHNLAPLPIIDNDNPTEDEANKSNTINSQRRPVSNPVTNKEEPAQPPKRRRMSFGSTLTAILLVCLIVPASKSSPIKITTFSDQPGIYFENLGKANILSNEWNLVVFYDMKPYWKEFAFLENCTQTLKKICKELNQSELCTATIEHLEMNQHQLSENNPLLKPNTILKRYKRGAVNLIGNIANSLFGVLDSNYAAKMVTIIEDINSREEHLRELAENQTSLVDATLNVIKQQEKVTSSRFKQVMKSIDENMHNIVEEQQKVHIFNMISIVALSSATNLIKVQSCILDTLADTQNGKINPMLITPHQLLNELIKIKTILPPTSKLPIDESAMLNYFKIMTITGTASQDYIIFKIVVPLASLENFELFKVTPVPVLLNSTFFAIQPSLPFLIINLHRDQYYPITQLELQICIIISPGEYICKQHHPLYRRGSTISACEIDIINQSSAPKSCRITEISDGPHWIQLVKPNQWIFALREPITINVVCALNTTQYTLNTTGLLQIRDQCTIKQQLVTIQSHNVYPSTTRLSFMPNFNISQLIGYKGVSINMSTTVNNTLLPDVNTLQEQVSKIKTAIQETFTHHDAHQVAVGYTSMLLGVSLLIAFIITCIRHRNQFKSKHLLPTPTPRNHRTTADFSGIRFDTSC